MSNGVHSVTLPDANLLSAISPWDLRYHQVSSGRLRVDVSMLSGTFLNVLDFKTNLGLHQLGSAPKLRSSCSFAQSSNSSSGTVP